MSETYARGQADGRFAVEDKSGAGMVRVATLNLWGRGGERDERRRVLAEDSVCWAVVAEVFARA